MTFIAYVLLRLGLFMIFCLLSTPLLLALGLVIALSEDRESLDLVRFVAAALILAWFLGSGWWVQQTANRMMFENKNLGPAMKLTFLEARLCPCFLPVVGGWFAPRADEDPADPSNQED